MPRSPRRAPGPLVMSTVVALGTLLALAGCTGGSGDQDSMPAPEPSASSAGPLTRQQVIARASDLTLRVEVTTCTGYQSGSGFLVGPRLVATAAHLLEGAQTVAVRGLHDESLGTVIGSDAGRDVALIRTSADVGIGDALVFSDHEPQQGDEIVAIGYPNGRPQSPTSGTVSRLDQSVDVDERRLHDLVQFDADAGLDTTGGPLLDLLGEVIGITDVQDDYTAGVNYALSSKTARPLIVAWTDSPAEVIPAHCPDRSTAVSDRSDSADGPGIAYGLRAYFDNLNEAVKNREAHPGESYGYYDAAYQAMSGRLQKERSPLERFRQDRLHGLYSNVRLVSVRRVDEVTDSAEVTYRRTVPKDGDDECTYYHGRYQMRLASGEWKLDERKTLADNGTSC